MGDADRAEQLRQRQEREMRETENRLRHELNSEEVCLFLAIYVSHTQNCLLKTMFSVNCYCWLSVD